MRMILRTFAVVTLSILASVAQAGTWECLLPGADQKVILTQQGKPEKTESGIVKGTVTGPYGKKHNAGVSIRAFDRRWDYKVGDEKYVISMEPSGRARFYDFTGMEKGESTMAKYLLYCEDSKAKEAKHQEAEERRLAEQEQKRKEAKLKAKLLAEENERRSSSLREVYTLAVILKIKRNWIPPAGSERIPECWVRVLQGPGGIILDVTFGTCKGSTASYRASIENAVYKAEPLPKPGDPSLFERELNFNFRPE